MGDYSEIIYESKVSRLRHPDYLATLGFLLGLPRSDIRGARILAVGCGTGRHLVPLAHELPQATIVGVDPEADPLRWGRELARLCRVSNLTLLEGYVGDLQDEHFDIILVHGVYSWISHDSRAVLRRDLARCLQPGGIMVVSHNVVPGWRIRQIIKDAILLIPGYQEMCDVRERISLVRDFLAAFADNVTAEGMGYTSLIAREVGRLQREPDHYLRHELMHDLADGEALAAVGKKFANEGLQYLGDALWQRMAVTQGSGVIQDSTAVPLGAKLEQRLTWRDLTQGEAFRESLFIRSETSLTGDSLVARLRECFFVGFLEEQEYDSRSGVWRMVDLRGRPVTLRSRSERSVVSFLTSRWPHFTPWLELCSATGLASYEVEAAVESLLKRDLLIPSLRPPVLGSANVLGSATGLGSATVQPLATLPWIAHQAAQGELITNGHYDAVEVGGFERALIAGIAAGNTNPSLLAHYLGQQMRQGGANEIPTEEELVEGVIAGLETLEQAAMLEGGAGRSYF